MPLFTGLSFLFGAGKSYFWLSTMFTSLTNTMCIRHWLKCSNSIKTHSLMILFWLLSVKMSKSAWRALIVATLWVPQGLDLNYLLTMLMWQCLICVLLSSGFIPNLLASSLQLYCLWLLLFSNKALSAFNQTLVLFCLPAPRSIPPHPFTSSFTNGN